VRRVAVIGCGGAGKTTLARELGARLGLPVVHADFVVYRTGDAPRPELEWQAELAALADGEAWVIDAMKVSSLEHRVARADTVVFLDLPRRACYLGVLRRRLRYRGLVDRERGVADRITWEFLRWVGRFPREVRPRILDVLERHAATTEVVVLRTRRQVRGWLRRVPERTSHQRSASASTTPNPIAAPAPPAKA
jgi:adenylate kinase family enzyme